MEEDEEDPSFPEGESRKPVPAAVGNVVGDETQPQLVYLHGYLTGGQPHVNV